MRMPRAQFAPFTAWKSPFAAPRWAVPRPIPMMTVCWAGVVPSWRGAWWRVPAAGGPAPSLAP